MKIKTYIPDGFPSIIIGDILPIKLSSEEIPIGKAILIERSNSYYQFDLSLNHEVSLDLYPSIQQSSTNGIIDGPPSLSLSTNSQGGFATSLRDQVNG